MIVVGTVGKAHALRGEVEVITGSDEPDRLGPPAVFTTPDGRTLTATSYRRHHGRVLIGFEEVTDRTAAEALRGTDLLIPDEERRQLGEDEWWPEDLEGLSVHTVAGEEVGFVARIVMGGSQDRLVITTSEGERDIPFVSALVPEVDMERRVVVIDPPADLL